MVKSKSFQKKHGEIRVFTRQKIHYVSDVPIIIDNWSLTHLIVIIDYKRHNRLSPKKKKKKKCE